MRSVKWVGGGATALIGLGVLVAGLLPPHMMTTGQVDPRAWALPMLGGALLLAVVLRWAVGRWSVAMVPAMLALIVPPLLLCLAASQGQAGRLAIWASPVEEVPQAVRRPLVGVLSGPALHDPAPGGAMAGFVVSPLWEILGRWFQAVPLAALDPASLRKLPVLLLIQPRALAPEELVALDDWVRGGGRAVVLADPALLWADARPLGHPLRPPPMSLLDPLLSHWGLALAQARQETGGDPVERRFLHDGRMIQIAGASHFVPSRTSRCTLSSAGLVAHCALGRGGAILIADADFANDALWTSDPQVPYRTAAWTSDAVAVLIHWLSADGIKNGRESAGKRVWLTRGDGLAEAMRPALFALSLFVVLTIFMSKPRRTKPEL